MTSIVDTNIEIAANEVLSRFNNSAGYPSDANDILLEVCKEYHVNKIDVIKYLASLFK